MLQSFVTKFDHFITSGKRLLLMRKAYKLEDAWVDKHLVSKSYNKTDTPHAEYI